MAITREQLKTWFLKGKKPLEVQFHAWIDSFWHKDDAIPMNVIEGLEEAISERTIDVDDRIDRNSRNPVQNKVIAEALENVTIPVDTSLNSESTNPVENRAVTAEFGKVQVDEGLSILKVQKDDDTYYCRMELLQAPGKPSISPSTNPIASTDASVKFTLSASPSDSSIYYTIGKGTTPANPTTDSSQGKTFYLAVSKEDASTKYIIKAASRRNGLWSQTILNHTVITRRKISISANVYGTEYDDERDLVITCVPSEASIRYTLDDTDPLYDDASICASGEVIKLDNDSSLRWDKGDGQFILRAYATMNNDSWQDSAEISHEYDISKKKAYYGFSTKPELDSSADIKGLAATGGSKPSTTLQGALVVNDPADPEQQITEGGYIWLCCTGTINTASIVSKKGEQFPFGFIDTPTKRDGWNCYRCSDKQMGKRHDLYIP